MAQNLLILSPEKTVIEYRLATVGSRLLAFFFDLVIFLVAATALMMILGIASGNRDESVWERAGEFWLERDWQTAPEILTFGPGPHLCLGNMIARMEARVVLELVFQTFAPGRLRLAPGFVRTLVPMFLEYGPERLDVITR